MLDEDSFLRKVIEMKNQKYKIKIMFTLLFACILSLFSGCSEKEKATPKEVKTIPPTKTGAVLEEIDKDLDDNGTNDKLQIISLNEDGGETAIRVYLNEDDIFEYEEPDIRLVGIDSFEYLDLDGDKTDEIFITTDTNANSRPYKAVLCLKQMDGKWNQMDLPKNEGGYHEFPFQITKGKGEFDFIISSEDTDQIIQYDASGYFKEDESNDPSYIQDYRKNNYKEGDEVGFISAWGIHDAKTGTYKGDNCIIVNQGIEGPYGHSLGEINVYVTYSEQGKAEILKFEYIPD